jgi:hypothetical protein
MIIKNLTQNPRFKKYEDELNPIVLEAHAFHNFIIVDDFKSESNMYIAALYDDAKLISGFTMEHKDYPYWQIIDAYTDPAYNSQNCFRYFLEIAVEFGHTIVCDPACFNELKPIWSALTKMPGRLNILQYDINSYDTAKITNIEQINASSSNLIAASKPNIVRALRTDIEKLDTYYNPHTFTKQYEELIFGPNSSIPEYTNP